MDQASVRLARPGVMKIEIEKKFRLSEVQRHFVLNALGEIGAEFTGEDFEENIIYSGGVLRKNHSILRIRSTQRKNVFTYKESIESLSDAKSRIEYETEIADVASLKKIVEALGFTAALIYEKRRQTWIVRNAEVVVDELPFGFFMEIEGSVTSIKEAEMLLGIESFSVEHETYPSLTARLGVSVDGIVEARFTRTVD